MSALYSCPRCAATVRLDVLGRLAPHPSHRAPRMNCTASGYRPKVVERAQEVAR